MRTKRIARCGVYVALAFILSYLESLLPFSFGIPGIKLGLANVVTMISVYTQPFTFTLFLTIARVCLLGFTFGNMYSLLYSLAGGLCSMVIMTALKRIRIFSIYGVSIAGGVTHNFMQILISMVVLESHFPMYYFPVLIVSGSIAGIFTGLLSGYALMHIPEKNVHTKINT